MSDDEHSGPHSGRGAPRTSRMAADKIRPRVPTIRNRVLSYALERPEGFTDEELIAALEPNDRKVAERSIRPRRTELANERWLLPVGERQEDGNACTVWIHRDHHPNPPPVQAQGRPIPRRRADEERADVLALLQELRGGATFFESSILETAISRIAAGEHVR